VPPRAEWTGDRLRQLIRGVSADQTREAVRHVVPDRDAVGGRTNDQREQLAQAVEAASRTGPGVFRDKYPWSIRHGGLGGGDKLEPTSRTAEAARVAFWRTRLTGTPRRGRCVPIFRRR